MGAPLKRRPLSLQCRRTKKFGGPTVENTAADIWCAVAKPKFSQAIGTQYVSSCLSSNQSGERKSGSIARNTASRAKMRQRNRQNKNDRR